MLSRPSAITVAAAAFALVAAPVLGLSQVQASEPFIAEIKIFAGTFAPRGYAMCDGQLLSIAQNTALFSILGFGGLAVSLFVSHLLFTSWHGGAGG